MKNWILAALVGITLAGCVSSQIVPKKGVLRFVHSVSVVPIESPPLFLHPKSEEDRAAIAAMMKWAESPATAVAPEPGGPGASPAQEEAKKLAELPPEGLSNEVKLFYGGMLMGIEAALSGKEIPGEAGTIIRGRAPVTWVPSVEFAKTAASLLKRKQTLDVSMIDGYVKLPIADRSTTWHLENWMKPIRRWYGSDEPGVDYALNEYGDADLVLEVGVLNYEHNLGRLVLQVWVRLIDPESKQVIGRARNWEQLKVPLAPLLENGAEGMKRLLSDMGKRLVAKCLVDVGLTSQ